MIELLIVLEIHFDQVKIAIAPLPDHAAKSQGQRGNHAMEADDPVTVYTLNNPYQAEIIKAALRGEGISCELDGERQAGLSEILEIGVLVRARDADRARNSSADTKSTGQGASRSGAGVNNGKISLFCRPSRQTRSGIGWNIVT